MDIRFWGTRGSLAKPGRITLRHGGNTSCVEVRGDDGTLIVLDCGTGAHGLGQALLSAGPRCDGHRSGWLRFVRRLPSYYGMVRLLVSVHHRLRLLTFPMRTVPLTRR